MKFLKIISILPFSTQIDFDKIDNSEEPQFCWSCRKNNISFQTLSPLQIQKLFVIPKNCQNQNDKEICWSKICENKNNYPENSLTCCYCKYVSHEKCAIYKAANKFIRNEYQFDMFSFRNIQDHDILDLTFNSNVQCIQIFLLSKTTS